MSLFFKINTYNVVIIASIIIYITVCSSLSVSLNSIVKYLSKFSIVLFWIKYIIDGIVDIMETGSTLRENGLVVFDTVCDLSARLIVNKASFKLKQAEISQLLEDLKKVMEDESC